MKGKITEIKQNEKNFFFKIEDDTRSFSGFGVCEFKVGDVVEFGLRVNGKYNNALNIEYAGHDEIPAPMPKQELGTEDIDRAARVAAQVQHAVKRECAVLELTGMDLSQAAVTTRLLLGLGA